MNPVSKSDYNARVKDIASREFEKNQVVLLGDCVVENIDIATYFPQDIVYNNGVHGDNTVRLEDTLYKRAIKYRPSKLFLSIGSNDLAYESLTVKDIYHNIITIIDTIRQRSKTTEMYLITTLPIHPAINHSALHEITKRVDNFDVNMLNYYLKNYARKHRIKVVDAYKHLKNDFDQLCIDYTTDGFHLNDAGYERYTELIKQYV